MSTRTEQVNRNAGAQIKKLMANLDAANNDAIIKAITTKLILAQFSEGEAESHRLDAGRMLLVLRKRIEGDGGQWWKWYHDHFTRSRKDAEKVMRLASATDPEAAAETERAETRTRVAKHRAERTVRSNEAAHAKTDGATSSNGNVVHLNRNQAAAQIEAVMMLVRQMDGPTISELLAAIEEYRDAKEKAVRREEDHHAEVQGPHFAGGHR
jgi:hypothetical protein